MKNIEDFLDFVEPYAPDVDITILQFHIQEAIVNFFQTTKIATDYVTIPLYENVHDYVIPLKDNQVILALNTVSLGKSYEDPNYDLTEIKSTEKPYRYGYWADLDNDGSPSIWIGDPSGNDVCEVKYCYSPKRGLCEVPDYVFEKYVPIIQNLALATLYAIPGQEWTNPQYAFNLKRLAEDEMTKIRRKMSNKKGGMMIAKPFVGRTRSNPYWGFFKK